VRLSQTVNSGDRHSGSAARLPEVWLLLPAFNEAESLALLLPKIKRLSSAVSLHTIVCDDASTDATLDVLGKFNDELTLDIIVHKMNRGLGETIRDLFERVNELCSATDVIVRMDCDDTHDPAIILSMIDRLNQGCDVVVASRFQPGGGQVGVSPLRSRLSAAANLFMKLLFPIRGLKEYSCGYRAYRASVIKAALAIYGNDFIQLRGLGFSCTLEKLVKLRMLGARFGEVPFVLRYDRKTSQSKMVANITTFGYLTLAVLYYWPWNGWRNHYKHIPKLGQCDTVEAAPKHQSCRSGSGT
jgi:dolichol-phosphate mannosyltransferase